MPHQIFKKDTFQNYILGYNKHDKFNCLRDIICFLLVKNQQEMGKMHYRIDIL